ncbi:MAG: DNA recombination protein RmuC [Planctomycetota bacterium]|nr:DNA recombination protein RmuC [Planctomycetota bacterium]MDA1114382.1 DNA recombination protein RmuC [Planctomycetota bacterium]
MEPLFVALLALAALALGGWVGLVMGRLKAREQAYTEAVTESVAAQTREAGLQAQIIDIDKQLAAAVAREEVLRATFEAEKRTAEELRKEMQVNFKAIAGDALKDNSQSLLERTELHLKPFHDQLKDLSKQTRELEEARGKAQGALKHQLHDLQESTRELRIKSESLTTALRGSSQARGQWGENVLQRVFELAGMTEGMHFRTQVTTADGLRPDFLVLLPGGDAIPVDSKVPMAAFLDAQAEPDPIRKKALLAQHAQDLRSHVRALERKDYSSSVEGSVDFTVLFLPGDHLLEAAYQANPRLQEESMEKKILLATPVTLLALLRTVSLYWQQEKLARNAAEIASLAKEYHGRVRTFTEHLSKTGSGLTSAVKAFNSAVGSYNHKILPQGKRLEELADIDPKRAIEDPKPIETEARSDLSLPNLD